jgi:fucokinase
MTQFPFDHVVITFPDRRAADSAQAGPLQTTLSQQYPSCSFHATTDPLGSRVGSGGGTLAALHEYSVTSTGISSNDDMTSTVLILHAGGESSRCPTQMVLGKAWTSLPCRNRRLLTPIELWLEQCQYVFQGIPAGSVVVVASDTLLHLPPTSLSQALTWQQHPGAVLGLAVPAPLETAQNHGVFVLDQIPSSSTNVAIVPCRDVWQKPSLERLQQAGSFLLEGDEPSAWIDTGVIVWMPAAATALRKLAWTELALCTADGLKEQWLAETKAADTLSLPEYARAAALKVDLYTHFLQALSLMDNSDANRRTDYCDKHLDLPAAVRAAIFDALSCFTLKVLACRDGHFLHLGTTRELQDWLIQGSHCKLEDEAVDLQLGNNINRRMTLNRFMGTQLGLTRRLDSLTVLGDPPLSALTNVVYHSILMGAESSSIGEGSVVEHSWYETDHSLKIGKGCLVSGLRNISETPADRLCIPDGIMMQMLPQANKSSCSYVYMVLGVNDNIKKRDTIYGKPLNAFLEMASLSEDDLWDADCSKRMLWNAKLHPIATNESFETLFSWLEHFDNSQVSLDAWKRHPKLSLAEIRDQSDAAAEFNFRHDLVTNNIPKKRRLHHENIASTILKRKHTPTDLQSVIDLYHANGNTTQVLEVLHTLDNVFHQGLVEGRYDVCGRSCMVASIFLDELAVFAPLEETRVQSVVDCFHNRYSARSSDDHLRLAMDEIRKAHEEGTKDYPPLELVCYSRIMEHVAQTMTSRCICNPTEPTNLTQGRRKPVLNKWTIATAPARIDLSGGWTDTPPICFEYGSSVTGVAVCVDNKKPLSCRCRIVPGAKGIFLRSELRDGASGALLGTMEMDISSLQQLEDYCDPLSDCALLKCAVMCLAPDDITRDAGNDLQSFVNALCASKESVRLEIVVTSLLPHGSGLGTSSILAGCILAAVGECIGMPQVSQDEPFLSTLVDSVLALEQRLTTGGGFQDQLNGLVGGIKMVSSEVSVVPLRLVVKQLEIEQSTREQLHDSLFLAFTGKTRLAKNIVQNVLRRWSKRTPEIVETVAQLVQGAAASRDAVLTGDLDALGEYLTVYWRQKKVMAGDQSGVEPAIVGKVLSALHQQELIRGASLCGAGGGGFLAVLAKGGVSVGDMQAALQELPDQNEELSCFTWHTCTICDEGLEVKQIEIADTDTFNISWHDMP